MKKFVLTYICLLEGYKTAIKSLHWNAVNMSQHKLCDDIADDIAKFQDTVAEIEQGISGNLPYNKLQGTEYNITNLKKFVQDVIETATAFLKKCESKGDAYVGMKSECESFIGTMQKNQYLVAFTMKEDLKRRLNASINESKEEMVELTIGGRTKTLTESQFKQVLRQATMSILKQ